MTFEWVLQRWKDEWENTERNIDYDEDSIRDEMRRLLDGPDCLLGGYRHIWHTLKMKDISVPARTVVENLALWWVWQTQTLRFSHSRVYRWMEQREAVRAVITGAPNEKKMGKGLQCSFLISRVVLWSFRMGFVRTNTICSDVVAENWNNRKL